MLLEDAVGALEPVAGELVVDEHRNSGPEWQGASCSAGLVEEHLGASLSMN